MKSIGTFLKKVFIGKAENTFFELCRAIIVGGIAFLVDMLLLIVLKEIGNVSTFLSATLSFIIGTLVNYLLSTYWAYSNTNIDRGSVRLLIFTAISAFGLLLNNLIILYFDNHVTIGGALGKLIPAYVIGKIVATVIVFFWNFTARKVFIYRKKKTPETEPEQVTEPEQEQQ